MILKNEVLAAGRFIFSSNAGKTDGGAPGAGDSSASRTNLGMLRGDYIEEAKKRQDSLFRGPTARCFFGIRARERTFTFEDRLPLGSPCAGRVRAISWAELSQNSQFVVSACPHGLQFGRGTGDSLKLGGAGGEGRQNARHTASQLCSSARIL